MARTQHRIRPAGTYFVTLDCRAGRQLLKGQIAEILTDQILCRREKGYYHLADTTLEKAVQMVKGGASYRIGHHRKVLVLWQDGYHDWWCRNEKEYRAYAAYICQNPVKAGLAERAEEWPCSSANPKFAEFLDPMPQGLKAPREGKPAMSTLKG